MIDKRNAARVGWVILLIALSVVLGDLSGLMEPGFIKVCNGFVGLLALVLAMHVTDEAYL
ncbi:hypothetical protein [Kaistia granuli]|uniref:hypothetical protein n=1 Tax=Kaistia granuli TaxID=363259 RepID=UPI00037834F9|nr:hypothetical protein [Kaistia granuli]